MARLWMEPLSPMQAKVAWDTGAYNKMPILAGRVRDESTFGQSIRIYFTGPPQVGLIPSP